VTSNGASQHPSIDIQHVLALGVLVNLPGPTTEKLEATSVQYDISSSYQRLLIRMNNTGTQLLHPFGSLQVHDTSGHLLQDWSLKLDTFIPQTSIDYPLYIQHKSLSPGTYTAMLNLSYEHHHTLNFTTTFTVPSQNQSIPHAISAFFRPTSTNIFDLFTPWYWIAAVIALVILCGGVFFWGQKLYNLSTRLQIKRKQRMKRRS